MNELKMSISRARNIMGKDAEDMTDEEIQTLIDQLSTLARDFVQMVLKFE